MLFEENITSNNTEDLNEEVVKVPAPLRQAVDKEASTMALENNNNVEAGGAASPDGDGEATASGTNGFRVKAVSEINDSANAKNTQAAVAVKRKLPAWMLQQTSEASEDEATSSTKKCKTVESNESNSISNAAEVKRSNGSCDTAENTTNNGDTTNNEVQEPVTSNETSRSGSSAPENAASNSNSVQEAESSIEPSCSNATASAAQVQIKTDRDASADTGDADNEPQSSGICNPVNVKPAIKVEKADASSTSRESCKFGIRCYRQNPMHRIEEAHPGDHDYKRPNFPMPPLGTPDCPFGNSCYRRNPVHFQQYSHPPDTDFEKNYKNYRLRLRQRTHQTVYVDYQLDDEDDPFIDDGELDSDYMPTSEEEDYSEPVDYDDGDKDEE